MRIVAPTGPPDGPPLPWLRARREHGAQGHSAPILARSTAEWVPPRLIYDEAGAPGSAEPVRRRADGACRRVRGERCGRPRAGRRRAGPPSLSTAVASSRVLRPRFAARLDPDAPISAGYVATWSTHRRRSSPGSGHWCRTRGSAGATASSSTGSPSSCPQRRVPRLAAVPGVTRVHRSVGYAPRRPQRPGSQGAAALGPRAHHRGQRHQDRDLDDGIDPRHPFFDGGLPDAARLPNGPASVHERQGDRRALLRARQPTWKHAGKPFDPDSSDPRHPRRRHRGRQFRYPGPRAAARSPASLRAPTSATTRC